MQVPQHPGNTQGNAPAQSAANPYVVPNQALATRSMPVQQAQPVEQAPAQQGLVEQPQGQPVELLAKDILNGTITMDVLQQLVEAGRVPPEVANTAVAMVQQAASRQEQQAQQVQMDPQAQGDEGLGALSMA